MTKGLVLLGLVLVAAWFTKHMLTITSVRVDARWPRTVLATYGGITATESEFYKFPDEAGSVTSVVLASLDNGNEPVVVAGIFSPIDGYCLFGFDAGGTEIWKKNLSSPEDWKWPDVKRRTAWRCNFLKEANVRDSPGDEIIVVANHTLRYPTGISVIEPGTGQCLSQFWHMGHIGQVLVSSDFFGPGKPAIIACGLNNLLDGSDEGLRDGETQYAHWDQVPVLMVLDPDGMKGLGPPPLSRDRGFDVQPVLPYAYAFLDLPEHDGIFRIPPYEGSNRSHLENDLKDSRMGRIDEIELSTQGPSSDGGFGLDVHVQSRAILRVDRNLRLLYITLNSGQQEGADKNNLAENWHVMIKNGRYVLD